MRKIIKEEVISSLKKGLIDVNLYLNPKLKNMISGAIANESSKLGQEILETILENAEIAPKVNKPLCQDTGSVVIFLEIGREIYLDFDIYQIIDQAVSEAYQEGFLRKSIVEHPLDRVNTKDNTKAIVHTKMVEGDKLKFKVATKGGGAENMSAIRMLKPSDGYEGIVDFVLETVFNAKGNPCPPIIVGLGIGGNFEKSALLAKEALYRDLDDVATHEIDRKLEVELLQKINDLGVGPMGLGGNTTCLTVKVNSYPCHIASLPVAINIQCHSAREFEVVI